METRFNSTAITTNGTMKIVGAAIVGYDGTPTTEFHLTGNVWERIRPNSWQKAVESGRKIKLNIEHDKKKPLGHTQRNVKLWTENNVLMFEATLDDRISHHRDAFYMVENGDIDGASFDAMTKVVWSKAGHRDIRTLDDIELDEITITGEPAYKATYAKVRSEEWARIEAERLDWFLHEETQKRLLDLERIKMLSR